MKPQFLILPAVFALGSCTLGPNFKLPELPTLSSWRESKPVAAQPAPDTWWRLFDDPELTRLIERAEAANPEIAAAKARVETSRALVGADRAKLFPTLNLSGSAGVSRSSADALRANLPAGANVSLSSENYRSSFNLAYDPDLWGRNKRSVEASTAESFNKLALLDSQRLGVATEVARQYFLLRGLDAQNAVLISTLKSRQDALSIQDSKLAAGLIDGLASSRARTDVQLAENDIGLVQRQRGSAEHALAVLCGTAPSEFSIPQLLSSRKLPTILPGLPAEVLNRRPDVRAAAENLRAANARIGVAEANFYPNFNLTAGAGLESVDFNRFLDWENRVLSLGAGAAAPLLDGGFNQAIYKASRSRYDEALATYRQTLLIALREVEDALVDLKGLAKSRAALELALTSSQETRRLSQERYDKGLTSYFEVVDAERGVLQVRLVLSQIEAQQRITLAALAKALGGGWSVKG